MGLFDGKIFKAKIKNSESHENGTRVINKVGNANYFNSKNGKYYSDSKYTIEANDNTDYLLSLLNVGGIVSIPAGNFLCKKRLSILGTDAVVSGVPGKTKIVFDSKGYVNSGTGIVTECMIINKNYADEFIATTAQSIKISDIIFEYKRYSQNSPTAVLLLKNLKQCVITNCSFVADLPNAMSVTNLDFYNACKNVTVSNCSFINKTKGPEGGCIWVRNLTARTTNITGNVTENVLIDRCSFEKDSIDEVIAVYSVVGDVRNVTISNCDIKDYSDKQNIVLSAYSSDDQYYGVVDNVTINNNKIYSAAYNAFLILIGLDQQSKPTSNVIISNNKITSDSISTSQKTLIYNCGKNYLNNVVVNNNDIVVKDSSYYAIISYATCVSENNLSGKADIGIVGGYVMNNSISGAKNGIVDPLTAVMNKISKTAYGIRVYEGDCYLFSNKIDLDTESGACGIDIKTGGYITCTKNEINIHNQNQIGINSTNNKAVLNGNTVV